MNTFYDILGHRNNDLFTLSNHLDSETPCVKGKMPDNGNNKHAEIDKL